ncbi:MAG: DUF2254 domain-containing protein [Myxococcota bacterium]
MQTRFLLRQLSYDLDTNLLFRPAMFLLGLLSLGWALPRVEMALASRSATVAAASAWLAPEPATAQLLMATVAGAVMTVVSVVYSILLVALSLASMQFSTRILAGFMRDRLSRSVLGLFVGAFAYCLAVVRSVHTDPPEVPGFSVSLGLVLAIACLGALVLFIHHIVRSIQANVLVDRIAGEAEAVLDAVFPEDRTAGEPFPDVPLPHAVIADRSGYVQLVDAEGLLRAAPGARMRVVRQNGGFVARGLALVYADRPVDGDAVRACIDIGAERTMQDDAEFGLRQIVDIALKALSPAVNDPSTAATCVDHLGRLLLRVATRRCGGRAVAGEGGAVWVPEPQFVDLLDLAVEQIRQYGKGDMAAALRLMRVLGELAPVVTEPGARERIRYHADRVREAAAAAFAPGDLEELERRYAAVHSAIAA